jgi:hypothetical protein
MAMQVRTGPECDVVVGRTSSGDVDIRNALVTAHDIAVDEWTAVMNH